MNTCFIVLPYHTIVQVFSECARVLFPGKKVAVLLYPSFALDPNTERKYKIRKNLYFRVINKIHL
jgi:hypothetical protein